MLRKNYGVNYGNPRPYTTPYRKHTQYCETEKPTHPTDGRPQRAKKHTHSAFHQSIGIAGISSQRGKHLIRRIPWKYI